MEEPAKIERNETKSLLTWTNLRDLAIIALIVVVAWKLLKTDWTINIERFSFTDLLALILALFSVWLSVLFYFKADEGSSRFYDNSYKFTSEISVILGRIEAGFGERLKHLDEGYSGMRDAFGHLTANAVRADKEEGVVVEKTAELQTIVEDLANRAALDENEKLELRERLAKVSAELEFARNQLQRLTVEEDRRVQHDISPNDVLRFLAHRVVNAMEHRVEWRHVTPTYIRNMFRTQSAHVSEELMQVLREGGLLGPTGRSLTTHGVDEFKKHLIKSGAPNE